MDEEEIGNDLEVVDFTRGLTESQKTRITPVATIAATKILAAYQAFAEVGAANPDMSTPTLSPCTIFEHRDFDGEMPPFLVLFSHRKISV